MNAPSAPVPIKRSISGVTCSFAIPIDTKTPSSNEPSKLTNKVLHGNSEGTHSEIAYLATAPQAPPIATSSSDLGSTPVAECLLPFTLVYYFPRYTQSLSISATSMEPLLFLTGNSGKLEEARHFFGPLGYQVEQFVIDGEVPEVIEPQADNLRNVTQSKINQAAAYLSSCNRKGSVLVEDAGLFIDELNGFPGVNSALILEQIGLSGILNLMKGFNNRGAEFRACAAIWDGNQVIFGEGVCRGEITEEVRGDSGFGFDPIFSPEEEGTERTFAQMSRAEKGEFSHRRNALNSLKNQLE